MTALVDRLEQLARESRQAGRIEDHFEWIVELRNALPALLTALRAAKQVADVGESRADWNRLDKALAPLFGEDATP